MHKKTTKPELFILDVDGVMTDGSFLYSAQGKQFKSFSADDSDGLKLLSHYMRIEFVSADHRGYPITSKRIAEDMGYNLANISSKDRVEWIKSFGIAADKTIYMGDGFYDHKIFKACGYGIAPHNALDHTKEAADYITSRVGGDRAVAQACIHILDHFFGGFAQALKEHA